MTQAPPITLAEFLLARIAEDEERGRIARPVTYRPWVLYAAPRSMPGDLLITGRRVLAECAAKRWLVETFAVTDYDRYNDPEILRRLALPYVDHPDYRPEWRA